MSDQEQEKPAEGSEQQAAEAKAAAKAAALEKAKAAAAAKAAAGEGAPAAKKPAHEEDPNKPVWEKDLVAPEWQDAWDDPVASGLKGEFGDAIEILRCMDPSTAATDVDHIVRLPE